MDSLTRLNAWSRAEAAESLRACCGARRWVEAMVARRPFATGEELSAAAREIWRGLAPADWKEAFAHHPRIGERESAVPRAGRGRAWSAAEQAGLSDAGLALRRDLAQANRDYEARFGYIYIVRAAGRTPQELLDLARARLGNDSETELKVAANEQLEITLLRLEKLLAVNC